MRNLLSAGLKKLRGNEPTFTAGNRQATVLAVAAQKGGVGKTTTAVNLACALARDHRQRVLIVDTDAQGHVGSSLREPLGLAQGEPSASLSEVLVAQRPRDLLEAVVESGLDNLHVTPADKQLAEAESQLSSRVGREYILQGAMRTARTHFDVIVIDCPPNLGNLTLNALVAADRVLIPCDLSLLAFEGVADLLGTIDIVNERLRHSLEILGIVRTRVDARTRQINEAIEGALDDNYRSYLMETSIPVNSDIAKAQAAGLSIYQFAPRSRGALAYLELATEVVTRLRHRPTTAALR